MIHRHLPVDVGSFGIEHGVLLWKKEQWLQEMLIRSVFVMHPSVFHELLNRNYIEFSHIKLLILDECHQAIRDHAYGSILKQYKNLWDRKDNNIKLPRLFSITTALLKTHCTPIQLEERIENLHHFFWYFYFINKKTNLVFFLVQLFLHLRILFVVNQIVYQKYQKKQLLFVKKIINNNQKLQLKSYEYEYQDKLIIYKKILLFFIIIIKGNS
jgi:hypothetical protein